MSEKPFKVAIGPSSFAEEDKSPLEMLKEAGCETIPNPVKRRLNEEETIRLLGEADGLLAGLEPLNRRVLSSARGLKALARVGIGMENVDSEAAAELGIKVSNTPDGPTEAVAEMTLAALLCILRQIAPSNNALHEGKWEKRLGAGLSGAAILLIGFGRIGRRFAEMLAPFKVDLMVCDPAKPELGAFPGARHVGLEEGLRQARAVSIHANSKDCVLGASELGMLPKGAILLNSARGHLIDEAALLEALKCGRISAAWLDVFREEPYKGPLIQFPQVLLTPHVSTYTAQCRSSMERAAVENLLRDMGLK